MCLGEHSGSGDNQFLCAATHHEGKKNADHNDEDNGKEDSPDDDQTCPPKNLSHGFLFRLEGTVRKGCCNPPSPFW